MALFRDLGNARAGRPGLIRRSGDDIKPAATTGAATVQINRPGQLPYRFEQQGAVARIRQGQRAWLQNSAVERMTPYDGFVTVGTG